MKIRNLIVVASVSIVLSACSNMPNLSKLPDLSALGKLLPPAGGASSSASSGGGGFFSSGAKSPNGVDLDFAIKKYTSTFARSSEESLGDTHAAPWEQQVVDELGKPSRSDFFELKHKDRLSSTVIKGRRSVIYYDTADATYVFVFMVEDGSEMGLNLYDRFKKPMVHYVYPQNLDLNDRTQAPEMSVASVAKVGKRK